MASWQGISGEMNGLSRPTQTTRLAASVRDLQSPTSKAHADNHDLHDIT